MSWYAKVSKDITHLPNCLDYFYKEIDDARKEVRIFGNVEKQSASLPGIVEQRFNQLQEIEAVLEYLNIELRRIRSKAFRKYLETYQRALSSRDCEKYVDGEADVIDMEII
jgi:superfamily I DNA/RNA helicase